MYKGKMYTVSFGHKPTQKKAIQAMAEKLEKVKSVNSALTFSDASAGYVYKGHPNTIAKCLERAEKKLGIPHFSLHKFRHSIMEKEEQAKRDAAKKLRNVLFPQDESGTNSGQKIL